MVRDCVVVERFQTNEGAFYIFQHYVHDANNRLTMTMIVINILHVCNIQIQITHRFYI